MATEESPLYDSSRASHLKENAEPQAEPTNPKAKRKPTKNTNPTAPKTPHAKEEDPDNESADGGASGESE